MIDKRELATVLGIEELAGATDEEFFNDYLPYFAVGLTEGDFSLVDNGDDQAMRRMQGLADTALTAAKRPDPPEIIEVLEAFAANYTNQQMGIFRDAAVIPCSVKLEPDCLSVFGERLDLVEPPQTVIDLGACMLKRGVVIDHITHFLGQDRLMQYTPMVRTLFPALVLLSTYWWAGGTALQRGVEGNLLFNSCTGPVEKSMDKMHAAKQASPDFEGADIILCTEQRHIEAVPDVVSRIPGLLKLDGIAVICSPLVTGDEHERSASQMRQLVREAGMRVIDTVRNDQYLHSATDEPRSVEALFLARR